MIYTSVKPKSARKGGYQLDFWHEFFAVLVFLRWLHVLYLSWFNGECCRFFAKDFQVEAHFAAKSRANFLLSKKFAINDNWIPSDPFSHVCFTILLMETYWSVDEKLSSPSLVAALVRYNLRAFKLGMIGVKSIIPILHSVARYQTWFETGSQQSSQWTLWEALQVSGFWFYIWRILTLLLR